LRRFFSRVFFFLRSLHFIIACWPPDFRACTPFLSLPTVWDYLVPSPLNFFFAEQSLPVSCFHAPHSIPVLNGVLVSLCALILLRFSAFFFVTQRPSLVLLPDRIAVSIAPVLSTSAATFASAITLPASHFFIFSTSLDFSLFGRRVSEPSMPACVLFRHIPPSLNGPIHRPHYSLGRQSPCITFFRHS